VPSVVRLHPGEGAPGREFTDPAHAREDLAAVATLRASLARRARSGAGGGVWTAANDSHWLVVPDLRALVESWPVFGVGFFGQAREVDHTPILNLERDLLARASGFRGLLAYYNVRFASGQWGNLVLFASEDDPARIRTDPTHLEAFARTPDHYRSVRLHRLRFPDGAVGGTAPVLESTLLIDFTETPPWRAWRGSLRASEGIRSAGR
ncbi:MAG TPA: hypothetical protein VIH85_02795, partial [Solirubrobacteraceae bacterium]